MSRGRHAKPSSLPSASTTLAAAAPAVLVVAAAAPGAGHQAAPAASARGAAAPVASAGLSPSGTAHGLRMQAARASAHPSWVMTTVQVRSGDSLSTLARRYYHHAGWWPRIWWANRHQVANPNEIRAGEAFIIPVPRAPRPSTVVGALHAIPKPPPPPPPAPAPVQQAAPVAAPAAAPAPMASSGIAGAGGMGAFQACVIQRESGGNPSAVNSSSGAGGLYQFLPSTWQALGHSGLPENASVAEQNQAFQQQYAQSGTAAWAPYDGC